MPNVPETLEQAREMLLQNNETITALTTENNTLKEEAQKNVQTINELRTLNQKYYLRLAQQDNPEPEKDPEPDPETLEDFTRNHLKGVII